MPCSEIFCNMSIAKNIAVKAVSAFAKYFRIGLLFQRVGGTQLGQRQTMNWPMRRYLIFFIGCSLVWPLHASSHEQITMHNKHFKIGAVHRPPVAVITKDKNGQNIIGGLLGKSLEFFSKARNCTFEVVIPDDDTFGNCIKKSNCTGMIGLVNRNEADFAIGMNYI